MLRDRCPRFPGLDAYHLLNTSWSIGTRARGAYWLTLLGEPLLGWLGGPKALRQSLPASVLLEPLEGERLLVRLGEWPLPGGAHRRPGAAGPAQPRRAGAGPP